jgi:hypothetical protein
MISRQRVTATLFASKREVFWGTRGYVQLTLPLSVFPDQPQEALELLAAEGWSFNPDENNWERLHEGVRQITMAGSVHSSAAARDDLDPEITTLLRHDETSTEWYEAPVLNVFYDDAEDAEKERYEAAGHTSAAVREALIMVENWVSRYVYGVITDGADWNQFDGLSELPYADLSDDEATQWERLIAGMEASFDPLVMMHLDAAGDAKTVHYSILNEEITLIYGFKVKQTYQRRAVGRALTALLVAAEERGIEHGFRQAG